MGHGLLTQMTTHLTVYVYNMNMQSLLTLFTLFCVLVTSWAQPTKDLEGRLEFGDKTPFNVTTRITLNNGEFSTYSKIDGSFTIYDVPPGIHQLDIHSTNYHFGQIKIQLLEDSMDSPNCLEYAFPGATKQIISYPLVMYPYATYQYFEPQKGFSILRLLKSPMVLMMIFGGFMMYVMPMMMEGLDPEEKAAMKKQMEAQQDPTKMFSQMLGGLTGAPEEEDTGKSRKERRKLRSKKQ
ncbi:unnamed protein product [Cylindrotheca closterium]|uniref:ER membrane protein complex subunit 7 beta-sandwich domain-containing protein n=1 Tax=Cylindrotheca closterium TaxID=2856 RepID=A0AAD2FXV9_9STRA|nr:unnamed protein product [Cylindrotheca closterium]